MKIKKTSIRKNKLAKIVFSLVFALTFFGFQKAQALTLGGSPGWNATSMNVSLDKNAYNPGERITVAGTGQSSVPNVDVQCNTVGLTGSTNGCAANFIWVGQGPFKNGGGWVSLDFPSNSTCTAPVAPGNYNYDFTLHVTGEGGCSGGGGNQYYAYGSIPYTVTCTPTDPGCAANTCTGSTCNDGCNSNVPGTKTDGVCAASCTASFSSPNLDAPGTSNLSWSSTNADATYVSCSYPLPIPYGNYGLSYANYPFTFSASQTGTETCTFIPYKNGVAGASCSANVAVSVPPPVCSPSCAACSAVCGGGTQSCTSANCTVYSQTCNQNSCPACVATFSSPNLNTPGTSSLSWSSTNADITYASCTGPLPIPYGNYGLSYANYPFTFSASQTGTETCTFIPYKNGVAGASCSTNVALFGHGNGCRSGCGTCSAACGGGTQSCTRDDCSIYSQSCNSQACIGASCSASFSSPNLTAPGTAYLSWNSNDADATYATCTGAWPIPYDNYGLSYVNFPFTFSASQTGSSACTFYPYKNGVLGTTCSASVAVSGQGSRCSSSCGSCSASCGGGTQTCTNVDCSTYLQSCNAQACCVPDHGCLDPVCGCGVKPKICQSICGGSCSGVNCGTKTCPPCNSGNWEEIAP